MLITLAEIGRSSTSDLSLFFLGHQGNVLLLSLEKLGNRSLLRKNLLDSFFQFVLRFQLSNIFVFLLLSASRTMKIKSLVFCRLPSPADSWGKVVGVDALSRAGSILVSNIHRYIKSLTPMNFRNIPGWSPPVTLNSHRCPSTPLHSYHGAGRIGLMPLRFDAGFAARISPGDMPLRRNSRILSASCRFASRRPCSSTLNAQ